MQKGNYINLQTQDAVLMSLSSYPQLHPFTRFLTLTAFIMDTRYTLLLYINTTINSIYFKFQQTL